MESTILAETQAFITKQREALLQQRVAILNQQQELQRQLEQVEEMLAKFDVFEGKGRQGRPNRSTAASRSSSRRGSKRDELLRVIREGGGLTRGQILEKMGLKGNKSGEMSVSNALTALTKNNQIRRGDDRKYITA